jgi:uncharacterized phage protein (TIGR02218 family)
MSFSADEKSIHDGQGRELYDFTLLGGDTAAYYYTDYDADLSVLSNNYVSVPISRTRVVAVGTNSPSELVVRVPHNLGIVDELILKQPPRSVELELRRYHGNIANVSIVWKGFVNSCRIVGREAELRIPSTMMETLQSTVPSVNAQGMCNHVLYDDRCAAVRASFTQTTTVSAIDGTDARIVTATTLSGAADQTYRGGEIIRTTDGERRLIVDQTGDVLTLVRAFRNLSVSDAIDVAQGCDHRVSTCNSKFDNLKNFGGIPYIPVENLFRFGVPGV